MKVYLVNVKTKFGFETFTTTANNKIEAFEKVKCIYPTAIKSSVAKSACHIDFSEFGKIY